MWPFGSVVGVVQTVVLWQSEQSPVAWLGGLGEDTWFAGRTCNAVPPPT